MVELLSLMPYICHIILLIAYILVTWNNYYASLITITTIRELRKLRNVIKVLSERRLGYLMKFPQYKPLVFHCFGIVVTRAIT